MQALRKDCIHIDSATRVPPKRLCHRCDDARSSPLRGLQAYPMVPLYLAKLPERLRSGVLGGEGTSQD